MKGCGIAIVLTVLIYAISWIIFCGIYAAIAACFGWQFSWGIATGLWLIWVLLKGLFHVTIKK